MLKAVSGSGGGGSGTVTSVSVTTANGVSGSVATATTTPAISLTLGDITPSSVVSVGSISGTNLNAFTAFSGPASTLKTFTLPNASSTILTSNAAVTVGQGGTGIAAGTSGGIPYFSSTSTITSSGALTANTLVLGGGAGATPTSLGAGTSTQVLHGNASGAPTFGAVALTTDVSGILPGANGGTANGFMAFSGPTTSTKTFTLPDATATILTSNAAVTVAQGGTGIASGTSGGVPYFSASGTIASSTALTANGVVVGGGAGVAPSTLFVGFTGPTSTVKTFTLPNASDTIACLGTAGLFTAQQNFSTATITSTAASIAWNLNTAQVAVHTATENTTLANPTNMVNGGTYILKFIQAASAKTLAFGNAYKWPGGVAPTVSTGSGAVDVFTFLSDGTNMYGTVQQAFA